jgi:methionyl-tRNA synthetase
VVNIASRCAGFLRKKFDNQLSAECSEPELIGELIAAGDGIAALYEARDFQRAMRDIIALADRANQYIDDKKPWVMAKEEGQEQAVQDACSVGINCFRVLMTYLKPVLPAMAEKSESFLNVSLDWASLDAPMESHSINDFSPLIQRVDPASVEGMVEASKA